MANLVKCSCGWQAVDDALPGTIGQNVTWALPAMVRHWKEGHKVTASGRIGAQVRAAAINLARAQDVEFDEDEVPHAPAPRRGYATTDDFADLMDRVRRWHGHDRGGW